MARTAERTAPDGPPPRERGRHLREVRRKQGLSRAEVARSAGLTRRELARRRGRRAGMGDDRVTVDAFRVAQL